MKLKTVSSIVFVLVVACLAVAASTTVIAREVGPDDSGSYPAPPTATVNAPNAYPPPPTVTETATAVPALTDTPVPPPAPTQAPKLDGLPYEVSK